MRTRGAVPGQARTSVHTSAELPTMARVSAERRRGHRPASEPSTGPTPIEMKTINDSSAPAVAGDTCSARTRNG